MEKIRVGMIFHGAYPPHPRIENQALHLIKNNVEVFLFCITYRKKEATNTKYKGINLIKVYFPHIVYRLSALAYSFPFYHWIISNQVQIFVKKNKINRLHIHNMVIAQVVFKLNKKLKLPIVFDIHENIPEIMKHYPHLKTATGKLLINPNTWKRKETEFIFKADKVIVVTNDAKDEIVKRVKISKNKIKVLPNFTNDSFRKKSYSKKISSKYLDKFKVIYIGDTGQRRGLISVVKSVKFLKDTIPNLAIIIVGKSKDDVELQQEIINENASQYVFLEGWQQEDLISDYINMADVGICPILRNLHHDTTYANKLFQYALLSKPILASDCPAQANLILNEQWGIIHKANDEKDFANQLLFLYNNHKQRLQFGTNGEKSIANKYNFDGSKFNGAFYQGLKKEGL